MLAIIENFKLATLDVKIIYVLTALVAVCVAGLLLWCLICSIFAGKNTNTGVLNFGAPLTFILLLFAYWKILIVGICTVLVSLFSLNHNKPIIIYIWFCGLFLLIIGIMSPFFIHAHKPDYYKNKLFKRVDVHAKIEIDKAEEVNYRSEYKKYVLNGKANYAFEIYSLKLFMGESELENVLIESGNAELTYEVLGATIDYIAKKYDFCKGVFDKEIKQWNYHPVDITDWKIDKEKQKVTFYFSDNSVSTIEFLGLRYYMENPKKIKAKRRTQMLKRFLAD